jgi:hypothetical protein
MAQQQPPSAGTPATQAPHALKRLWLFRQPVGCWVSNCEIKIAAGYGPGRVIDRASRVERAL